MSEHTLAHAISREEGDPRRDRVVSALYKGHDLDWGSTSRKEGDGGHDRRRGDEEGHNRSPERLEAGMGVGEKEEDTLGAAAALPLPVTPGVGDGGKTLGEGSGNGNNAGEAAGSEEEKDESSASSSEEGAEQEKDIEIDLEAQRSLSNNISTTKPSDEKENALNTSSAQDDLPPSDPIIVDFDGPSDPTNATNWSPRKKWSNIAVIASITFLTPLASSMFAPGVPAVMSEFDSSNTELASFVVSVYILGYVFGPIVLAPLSEMYGRLPLYHCANVGFVIFTVACAVAGDLNMLIGFRFVEGVFGSCPITIGGGTVADMFVQEERGGVMAIWALGPLMGPVIGPVAGGYVSDGLGWRWVFWIIAIAAGAISLLGLFCLQETYPVVILEKKARRLRKETGNQALKSKLALPYTPRQLFKISIVRPLKMLIFSPIVFLLSLYVAIVYGYLYLLFTTLTPVFETSYNFSTSSVGLTYLGIGIGAIIGVLIFGFASDKLLKILTARNAGTSKPEFRLPPLIPGSLFLPTGLFIYGWTAQNADKVHWIAPIIGTALVGFGLLATFMPIQTYLVDAYTIYAASAIAANTIFRSLFGAILPLGGQAMYEKLGLGWGNSLLGFIALACCPIPVAFYLYGERIRKSKRFEVKL